jgi:hypothetical protein
MPLPTFLRCTITAAIVTLSAPIFAASAEKQCLDKWVEKSDAAFAQDCADLAFSQKLNDRELVAWLIFARTNQLIKDTQGVSQSGRVPVWMAWATDNDTFAKNPTFIYNQTNRDDITPVTSKAVLAGLISTNEPNGANEEVTRNELSYNYITHSAKLNTKQGVLEYIKAGNTVDMPVGTVEIKASWLKVPPSGAPKGALTYKFDSGTYWWRGIHLMVKMKPLPKDKNLFYTEEPSWFWTTFEFTHNNGVSHVREKLITQRAPLPDKKIAAILKEAGIEGYGFDAYTPNGTQIQFTVNGKGKEPVILGHTDMEDFAGSPNTAQPEYWTSFNSSCHTCHATAAINPVTECYFPFTVPSGALTEQYYGEVDSAPCKPGNVYLGDGFVPLDFMWPIVFNAQ